MPKRKVLILCTGNSARSQMAEGLLRHEAGDRFEVFSAGTKPTHVRPEAIEAMAEIGIDISTHRSKSVEEFVGQDLDYVITVCSNATETCPVFPGAFTGPSTTRRRWKAQPHSAEPATRSTPGSCSSWPVWGRMASCAAVGNRRRLFLGRLPYCRGRETRRVALPKTLHSEHPQPKHAGGSEYELVKHSS